MARKSGERRPVPPLAPKIEKVELSDEHLKLRIAAAVIFLIIAVAAITYGVYSLATVGSGWQEISASSVENSLAPDLTFSYDLGAAGASASQESRVLKPLYTQACADAYRIFDAASTGQGGIAWLNSHPNQEVDLDPALISALTLISSSGDRTIYLGPVWSLYKGLFSCDADWQTPDFDPLQNPDLRTLFTRISTYASDPNSVNVTLLGGTKARLTVSDDYLSFLASEGLTDILDLAWMENAFAVDLAASRISDAGYRRGTVSSYDGFARNLDDVSGSPYSISILDLVNGAYVPAGRAEYVGAMSVVGLRAFPVTEDDRWHYYVTESAEIKVPYLSITDGLPRTGAASLTGWSPSMSCAELLLELAPLYIVDEATPESLATLQDGINVAFPKQGVLYFKGDESQIVELFQSEDLSYTLETIR